MKKKVNPPSSRLRRDKPLVSVVIPIYNGASFLHDAVMSVFKSTYKNFEVLLIDDGSKDKSKILCHQLEKKYKHLHFYAFKKNKGLGRVLNFALKKAKGKYICRINQDDTMHPTRIAKQVAFLTNHPEVVLVGSWLKVHEDDGSMRINRFIETDEEIRQTWLSLSPCWDAAVMYRKKTAIAVGGYDQSYWPADDLHMWYRLGNAGKMANLAQPLTTIRFHGGATSMVHHRKHMIATYKAHRFAHTHVQAAHWYVQLFWIGQLAAGYLLPARFNWWAYRILKKNLFYAQHGPKQIRTVTLVPEYAKV